MTQVDFKTYAAVIATHADDIQVDTALCGNVAVVDSSNGGTGELLARAAYTDGDEPKYWVAK